jgi:hypothetical protein
MNAKLSFPKRRRALAMPLAAMLLVWIFAGTGEPLAAAEPLQKKTEDKAEASKESSTEAVPRVSLDEITGSPGAILMIPFYYTPDPKEPLRSLAADVEFVSNHLKFQKVSRGVIPDDVSAEITTKVTEGAPDDKGVIKSKLHVTVSLTDKNPQKGLPEGLLAFLLFQVTMDAKPFTIKLTPTIVSGEDINNPPRKIAKIAGVPGTVVVEIPDLLPEATCFFFSH